MAASLEEFVNRNLAQLDQMVRTGWFIIDRAGAKISLREVPHNTSEHAGRKKEKRAKNATRTKGNPRR